MSIDKNIALKDVLTLLRDNSRKDEMLHYLQENEVEEDDVKGVQEFLKSHEWDVDALFIFLDKSAMNFSKKKKANPFYSVLKVAVVAIPLIILGNYLFELNTSISSQKSIEKDLYTTYYVEEIGLPTTMSLDENKLFAEAMMAYKDDSYAEAKLGFERLLVEQGENDTLRYFIGVSMEKMDDYGSAIRNYYKIPNTSKFKEKAEYRTVLCFLKIKQYQKAKKELERIKANPPHKFFQKSSEILDKESAYFKK